MENAQSAASSASAPSHTSVFTNSHPYFPPSFVSPTEATPRAFDPRAQVESGFEELALEDFVGDEFAPTASAGPQWNLGAGNGGAGIVPDLGDGGLPILPKPPESGDGLRSAVLPPGRGAGTQQVNQHIGGEPIPAGFGPPPVRTMVQPENNQWQQHRFTAGNPSSRPISSAQSIPGSQKRRSTVPGPDSRVGDTSHCSECDFPKRQRDYRISSSAGTTRVASPTLPSTASYASGHSLTSPRTPTQISGSDVLRDHGIDLAQLPSLANSTRRQSISTTTPRRLSQIRGLKRPLSETSSFSHYTHHHGHSTHQEVFELERDEYDQECGDGSDLRVTKVVVIYMQECNCGPG